MLDMRQSLWVAERLNGWAVMTPNYNGETAMSGPFETEAEAKAWIEGFRAAQQWGT